MNAIWNESIHIRVCVSKYNKMQKMLSSIATEEQTKKEI